MFNVSLSSLKTTPTSAEIKNKKKKNQILNIQTERKTTLIIKITFSTSSKTKLVANVHKKRKLIKKTKTSIKILSVSRSHAQDSQETKKHQ